MTRPLPERAFLTDEEGRHCYLLDERGGFAPLPKEETRLPAKALCAIPSRELVSHPHWINSRDASLISQVVSSENEKLGIKGQGGAGRTHDWQAISQDESRTLVHSISIPWSFEALLDGAGEFTDFIPQFALYPAPGNSVALWNEAGEWVAGYAREGRWAHVQVLGDLPPPDLASEIQLTLVELTAKGILQSASDLVIFGASEASVPGPLADALREGTGLAVAQRPAPAPNLALAEGWRLLPHEVARRRLAASRRRRLAWSMVLACLLLLCLAGAGFLDLWRLQNGNERLASRIEANRPAAEVIEAAMERWYTLSPAIETKRSPVELFHRVSVLLPERGFRLTSFELQDHRVLVLRGEAATMANALQIKGAIENARNLQDFDWEIPPPRTRDDLVELVATGTYRF